MDRQSGKKRGRNAAHRVLQPEAGSSRTRMRRQRPNVCSALVETGMGTEQKPSIASSTVKFTRSSSKAMATTGWNNQSFRGHQLANQLFDRLWGNSRGVLGSTWDDTIQGKPNQILGEVLLQATVIDLAKQVLTEGTMQLLCPHITFEEFSEPTTSNAAVPRFWTCAGARPPSPDVNSSTARGAPFAFPFHGLRN